MRLKLSVALGACMLLLTGCGATRISRILQNPAHYTNRDVTVDGRVTNSFGAFVAGVYTVDDGTGKITVLSTRPVPTRGASVRLKGRVVNGVTVMGKSFGTTIREENLRVRR